MKFDEFVKMSQQGSGHWWYLARRSMLRWGLKKHLNVSIPLKILDLASACGDNFSVCREYGQAYGIDISEHSIRYCKDKNINTMVMGDVQVIPFAKGVFDAVVAFDVFEHLKRDVDAMREVGRILRPDGVLLVNVPAFMALYSHHDKSFDHLRRYTISEINIKLNAAGFRVQYYTYWSFFIFPAVYVQRRILGRKKRSQAKSDFHLSIPKYIEHIFSILSRIEFLAMSNGFSFPFGVSLYCIALKKD